MNIAAEQLRSKFKHARFFGVAGSYNRANARAFEAAVRAHVAAPATRVIAGTYRKTIAVVFYVDPVTGLMVMTTPAGAYISGWRLNPQQLQSVLASGRL